MDEYLKEFKKKKKSTVVNTPKQKIEIKNFISKILLSVIFFLISIIYINTSDKNLLYYKEHVMTESLPFTKVKLWYEDLFGEVLPKNENTQTVFDGKLIYKEINDYYDGESLTVGNSTLVNALASGIVVYVGEKDNYGNTIIVQGIDGADIWYGNITNVSVKLYDYIENGAVIGETKTDELYLVIKKDNEFIKYEEYQS